MKRNLKREAVGGGFTLIELLIVIAIIGVLAVVVLVAINPVQQLARARDAGRISSVSQLGHSVEAYYTAHNGTYPTVAQWTASPNILVSSGEINIVPGVVPNSVTALCGTAAVSGWCYSTNATSFMLYARLEALTNRTLGTCPATGATPTFIVYSSAIGRACIICQAGEPAAGGAITCQN
jgi:prepilin-type N-terminal cleavage/methylation domain-containing protein